MKRILSVLLIGLCTVIVQAQKDKIAQTSGYLITTNGKTINFESIRDLEITFKYGPEDKLTTIAVSRISEITFTTQSKPPVAHIVLRSGKEFTAKPTYTYGYKVYYGQKDSDWRETFDFNYFDDLTEELKKQSVFNHQISKIIFGSHFGRFRRCPHDNTIWPDTYLYCPQSGHKNVWGEPVGSLVSATAIDPSVGCSKCLSLYPGSMSVCSVCSGKLTPITTNTHQKNAYYFLGRSKIAPDSKRGQAAVELSKKWLNPFSTEAEIDKALQDVVSTTVSR